MAQGRGLLLTIYERLMQAYGPQGWWPGDGPLQVMVGAVLTQATNWRNVERAIARLAEAGMLSAEALALAPREVLEELVRPTGYYRAKAERLQSLARMLLESCQGDIERLKGLPPKALREMLLRVRGIGPETADSILLYALGYPYFVVDAYTRRLFRRLGYGPRGNSYHEWQRFFMEALPPDAGLFNEYHALIVRHGKERCRARPRCPGCPLLDLCPTGRGWTS
jgi:endonuclease-3 related protein